MPIGSARITARRPMPGPRVAGPAQSSIARTAVSPRSAAGRARTRGLAWALAGALVLSLAGAPAPAVAGAGSGPSAVVSMGDSYISGEAGRWRGNSVDPLPGNDATDRACVPGAVICLAEKTRVYVGGSAADGCHRSDIAEVDSARLAVAERVNIACSGAATGA